MNHGEFIPTYNPTKDISKCCVCNKSGHMSSKCSLRECSPSSQKRYQTRGCLQWKKKVNKCDLPLIAQDLKSQWYLDGFAQSICQEIEASL